MKLTKEQKERIVKELDPETKDGILYRVLDDLRRVFQPFTDPGEELDLCREYEISSEELEELKRDISLFEEGGALWEEYRLYERNEEEDDEVLYFDFNQDIIPVIDVIREKLTANYKISMDMGSVRALINYRVEHYLKRLEAK